MTYLDHAATTPMVTEAIEATAAAMRAGHGNPSSLHAAGRAARRVVEESRERIAAALGARPGEIVFTAGGTESDNLAVKGIFWARRAADSRRKRIVTSAVEHHAVLDAVDWLVEHEGAEATFLPVDAAGRVSVESLAAAIEAYGDEIAVVSVQWANNEIGTTQPIAELAALARTAGIPMHADAVQVVGRLPVLPSTVDALTVSGHKLGGPIGVGALVIGRDVACTPILHGGGQERDIRSGTLDTPSIAGFAVALESAIAGRQEQAEALAALRDELIDGVLAAVPGATLSGPERGAGAETRLPGIAHFTFEGCEGDALLMLLDADGIACSTGSACSAGVSEPSHVLVAMGADRDRASSALRFSLGHTSSRADVKALLTALSPAVERARLAAAVAR